MQAPSTQACVEQSEGGPHCPFVPQVWTPFAEEHCFAPGSHTPAHAPLTHARPEHAAPSRQVPVASHVWTTCPLHCVASGVHVPEHAPPLQMLLQGVSLCQTPCLSQFCGVKPSHIRVPATQLP
jgi:hypothetical protein